jgi:energy-converting hydrogenase Eha subunit C
MEGSLLSRPIAWIHHHHAGLLHYMAVIVLIYSDLYMTALLLQYIDIANNQGINVSTMFKMKKVCTTLLCMNYVIRLTMICSKSAVALQNIPKY